MAHEQDHVGLSDCCTQCGDLADYAETRAQLCVRCDQLLASIYNDVDEED